jgi:hypothetical protein
MTSILKVDTIQDTAGNNIINESGDTITIGASGDTITIPSGATLDVNGIDFPTADGTAGQALITDGSGTLSFSTVGAAAGQVIQVVTATDQTARSTTSTSFVTASNTLSVAITPSSASNKILILVGASVANPDNSAWYTIFRGATDLGNTSNDRGMANAYGGSGGAEFNIGINYLDSPNTTSATTYQVYFRSQSAVTSYLNAGSTKGSITCMEIKG